MFPKEASLGCCFLQFMPSIPQNCSKDCYVDGTKLLMPFQVQDCGREPTISAMNDDLIKLCTWCFDNRLLLNPDKTKLIVYGSRQMISKLQDFRLTLLGKERLLLRTWVLCLIVNFISTTTQPKQCHLVCLP